jgi:hypothetical protein
VFRILVEFREKRVFFEPLKHKSCTQPFAQHVRERGLPCSDNAFDRYMTYF